jgi:chromosome segregation ATPase
MRIVTGLMLLGALAAGCATTGSVKEQTEPLASRIAALEQRQSATDAKLTEMNTKMDAQGAQLQAMRQEMGETTASMRKAQDDLAAAAARAETAAQKSAKAFELTQMKVRK